MFVFTNWTMSQLNARLAEIRGLVDKDGADVELLTKEVEAIEARKAEIAEQEKEAAELRSKVAAGTVGNVVVPAVVPTEERAKTNAEIRNSLEYGKAFVKAMLTGDDTEARALLTTAVSGQIPVPETLEKEISNTWENSQIMSLVKKTNFPGTYKTVFELTATGAEIHVEGTAAPTEEELTFGTVEISAQNVKKWITVSDEAIENTTIDTLGYIYAEIAQKIAEKAEEIAIGVIIAAPAQATSSTPGVLVYSVAALGVDTVVQAVSLLTSQARNLKMVMNRRTYAALVSLALNANYSIDVFDGLKENIVFSDTLKAVQNASSTDTIMIIGDFSALVANFPNGEGMVIKTDDLSLAEKDLVKIVGRQFFGIGLVADKRFVKVALS